MSDSDRARPLQGPNMPADNGLTALGMIMQLGGHVFLAVMAFFTFTMLLVSGLSGRGGDGIGLMLLVGVTGIVRSGLHRAAGAALVNEAGDSTGRDPFRLTSAYVWLSLTQSVLVLLVLNSKLELGGAALAQMALMLLAWPATLLVVIQSDRFRRFRTGIPMPEDRGFEGAGVLMLLGGVVGAIFSGVVIVAMLGSGPLLQFWQGWLILLTMVLLAIRSMVHAGAGSRAVNNAGPARFSEKAVSYVNWGIGTAAVAGGALFLLMAAGGGGGGSFLAMIGVMVYLLLAWPLVVKTVIVNRDVMLFGDEGDAAWHRAPDLGMTALGWLMLAFAVIGLASVLPMLFTDDPLGGFGSGRGMEALLGGGFLGSDLAAKMGRSEWFSVATAAVQLWAAVELITMSRRWKLATVVYGVVAALISIYVSLPLLENFGRVFENALGGGYARIMILGQVAMSLVLPIGAIALANRTSASQAPTAQARLRERD